MDNREIEVRFLEVDVPTLQQRLRELGAKDLGEELLDEIIYYDKENTWQAQEKFVRIRRIGNSTTVSYKHHQTATVDGTMEVEFKTADFEQVKSFLGNLGFLYPKRQQQKKRHKWQLREVILDFDTWPKIPTFLELEGPSEELLKETSKLLNLSWDKADKTNASAVIMSYGIPVKTLSLYTFDKIE